MNTLTHSKMQLQPEAFHGLAGEIVQIIEPHSEADPAGLLTQLLVSFGNIVGRRSHFVVEASRHYTNMNLALVGDTSNGRKGTSWNHIAQLFADIEPDWKKECVKSGLSSGEGLIWNVRDPVLQRGETTATEIALDAGVQDKRLMLVETEFASVLKVLARDGNTLSAVIRNAWDTGDLSTLTKNQPAKATGAHISIVGHVTKAELDRYLADTEAANGFGNRFLWIFVRRSKLLPRGGSLGEQDLKIARDMVSKSVRFSMQAREVRRSVAADNLWDRVYAQLTEGRYGILGAITARAAPQVMRMALIYALLDQSSLIDERHLKAALAVWKYSDQSCRIVFGETLGDPVADELIQVLRGNPSGLTRTEISAHFKRNKSASELGRALDLISSQGIAAYVFEPSGDGQGRPIERWYPLKTNQNYEINEIERTEI